MIKSLNTCISLHLKWCKPFLNKSILSTVVMSHGDIANQNLKMFREVWWHNWETWLLIHDVTLHHVVKPCLSDGLFLKPWLDKEFSTWTISMVTGWITHFQCVWFSMAWLPVCFSISTSVSSVGAPSSSFSVRRLPQAFSSLETSWRTCFHASRFMKIKCVCDKTAVSISSHQLKEECRLAQRLGCWVRDVRDLAALPLRWCGNTAGEKTLFILTARWGQTPCSLSNTWWTRGYEDGDKYTHSYL